MEKISFQLNEIEDGRLRIIITSTEGVELGSLYFEKAKKSFQRKPIGMDAWACVDAKVEGLYEYLGDQVTPKDIVAHCQELIRLFVAG